MFVVAYFEERHEFKVFERREDAIAHAALVTSDGIDRTEVYEVANAKNARAAKAAVEMGEGVLIDGRSPRASQKQINEAALRELYE